MISVRKEISKSSRWLSAAAILVAGLICYTGESTTNENLLKNGGFEGGMSKTGVPEGWSANFWKGTGEISVVDFNPAEGTNCFRMDAPAGAKGQWSQRVTLEPGSYTLSYRYYFPNPNAGMSINIRYPEMNPPFDLFQRYKMSSSQTWKKFEVPIHIEKKQTILLHFGYLGGNSPVFLDDVVLVKSKDLSNKSLWSDNLLAGGDMQQPAEGGRIPAGWNIVFSRRVAGMEAKITDTNAREGRKCLFLPGKEKGLWYLQAGIPYERNSMYRMSFSIYTKNCNGNLIRFGVNTADSILLYIKDNETPWQKFTYYVPAEMLDMITTSIDLVFKVYTEGKSENSIICIDDVEVVKTKDGSEGSTALLFPEGEFESATLEANWDVLHRGKSKAVLDREHYRSGKQSLRVDLVPEGSSGKIELTGRRQIPLNCDNRYYLSGALNDNIARGNVHLGLIYYDATGTKIGDYNKRLLPWTGDRTWTQNTWKEMLDWGLEIPAGATSGRINILIYATQDCPADRSLWIDDIALVAVPSQQPTVMDKQPGPNILEGGSFEVGMDHFVHEEHRRIFTKNSGWPHYRAPVFDIQEKSQGLRSLRFDGHENLDLDIMEFNPFKLPPGYFYTLAFDLQGTGSVTVQIEGAYSLYWHSAVVRESVRAEEQWKHHSFTFAIPYGRKLAYEDTFKLKVVVYAGNSGSLWLDGISLNKGPAVDFQPFETVEIGIEDNSRYFYIYDINEKSNANLLLYNNQKQPAKGTVKYTISDTYHNCEKTDGSMPVKIGGQQRADIKIPLYTASRGAYYLKAQFLDQNGKETGWEEFVYTVIHPKKAADVKYNSFFGLHHVTYISGNKIRLYDPEVGMKIAQRVGFRWIREFGLWTPNMISSNYEFHGYPIADCITSVARKHGILIMPILGAGQLHSLPQWMRSDRIATGHTTFERSLPPYMPDEKKYRQYIKTVVTPFAGRIPAWEVWNEPWVSALSTNDYLDVHKWTAEEIRKADPDAKIVGMCFTGDLGLDIKKGLKKAVKNMRLRDVKGLSDVISVHWYGISKGMTLSQVDEYLKLLEKQLMDNDEPLEIWNTETCVITSYSVLKKEHHGVTPIRPQRPETSPVKHANRIMQFNLTGMGTGYGKFFHHGGFTGLRERSRCLIEPGGFPRPVIASYNFLIELLDDADSDGKVALAGENECYLFTTDTETILAMWNPAHKSRLVMPADTPEFKIYDIMGSVVKRTFVKKQPIITLSDNVLYLVFAGKQAEKLRNLLSRSEMPDDYPIIFGDVFKLGGKQGNILRVKVEGKSATPVTGRLTVNSDNRFIKAKSKTVEEIKKGEWRFIEFPVDTDRLQSGANTFSVLLESGGKSSEEKTGVYAVCASKTPVKVDGQLNEWTADSWIDIRKCREKEGETAEKRQGRFAWSKDKNRLYFALEYEDRTPRPYWMKPELNPWSADAVELFIDFDLEGDWLNSRYNEDDLQMILSPGNPNSEKTNITIIKNGAGKNLQAEDIEYATRTTPTGYILEISLPLEKVPFPKNAGAIGMDFSIIDINQEGDLNKPSRQYWSGNNSSFRNTFLFGTLLLP